MSASRTTTADEDRLDGAAQDHGDVGALRRRTAAGIDDRAEQQQLRAAKAVADLDLPCGNVGHEHRLVRPDQPGREAQKSERGEPRFHRYSIEKISSGRQNSPRNIRKATSKMITASASRR